MMFWRRKTQHKAGGLKYHIPQSRSYCGAPIGWEYPAYIDGRPYQLPSDDQGRTSQCAAFAMAGIIESVNWWQTGKRVTVDPVPIYAEAKRIDGEPGQDNGTTLDSIVTAAQNLSLLNIRRVFDIENGYELRYALHKFPLVLGGFRITKGWNDVDGKGVIRPSNERIGGHAVDINYYDQLGVGILNSWGTDWARNGMAFLRWDDFSQQFFAGKGFEI